MSKNRTILDIAILTAGRVDLFSKCVDAVLPQLKPGYQVVVHNNGHPSKEYEEIYKRLPEGSIIKRSNSMSGFSDGANLAIRAGNDPLVLFITDDVFLKDEAIEVLLKRMEDKSIGQCGLKLVFPETDSPDQYRPSGKVQHVGMASTVRGEMIHPLIGWSADHPKCNISREVLAVTGATFMVRRDIFNRVGGFNPAYEGGYYEDMELSFAIRENGGRIFIDTDAVATHCVGATFGTTTTNKPNIQKNKLLFQSRWLTKTPWDEWKMW